MFKFALQLVFILSFLRPSFVRADVDSLISRASEAHLADDPYWHTLLHYRSNKLLPGVTSEIDDQAFFNAANGKTDPDAELKETIRGFFTAPKADNESVHPQCAFPARLDWLTEKLSIDRAELPVVHCDKFDEWFKLINPNKVTLVFPEAFMNNPASMFGHTLLRVDDASDESRSGLLGYGANYSAQLQGDLAPVYAFKGVFGLYEGHFAVQPYYQQVKKYSDFESRDIWEYELSLSPAEVERAIKHLWELHQARIDYYYFSENCSYMLLSLLEVARPGLSLTTEFRRWGWAIPIDTVRAVSRTPGLVAKVTYRPSQGTILRYRAGVLPETDQDLAKNLTDPKTPLAATSPEVLELSYDFLMYRLSYGKLDDTPEIKRRAYELLSERSKFPPQEVMLPQTPPVLPQDGHPTKRLSIGGGFDDKRMRYQVNFRPAFHDLLDPPGGYAEGAQITFFDLMLQQTEESQLRLGRFTPIEITSIAPRRYLLRPISWKVAAEVIDDRFADKENHHSYRLTGGPGLTYKLFDRVLFTAFLETTAEYSQHYLDNYRVGVGPGLQLVLNQSERWGAILKARALEEGIRAENIAAEVSSQFRYSLSKNIAARIELSQQWRFDDSWTRGLVSLQYYF